MTIQELNNIIKQKNVSKILQDLMILGYKDMTKDSTLKDFNLADIAKSAIYEMTEYHESRRIGLQATLHKGVRGLLNHEIIWLQVDKINIKQGVAMPTKCYLYFIKTGE